ncbi:cupredoxin domain-containing protein [Longimicrobium terrae]|uniref:Plastocyanin domain-containing protein n=1 Tax=Longimicrobium terrae TaxID=1639882 RepID=A0A841GXS7_9BACT|nr:cupredoxin domain-containing protein [Longimicrobium terrae]MBB4636160.1 plastocyanin domain-containing protein [Longimicrobium terrae]MBB6070555.1 plastocyanin domain-containing protein [Longimicrobium terrae]NNC29541.1 cupredoxin domain-containing protein [Longimicrobium terrae]
MDTTEIAVLTGGIVLIALVLWYFLGERQAVAATDTGGVQEVDITVHGGYSPSVVTVRQGRPVRLNFFRDETSSCSEQVILGDFGIARDLPAHQTTAVEFTPDRAGEFTWTCGMNMLRGKLIVQPA